MHKKDLNIIKTGGNSIWKDKYNRKDRKLKEADNYKDSMHLRTKVIKKSI